MGNQPIKKWRCANFDLAVWLNTIEKNGVKTEFKTVSLSRNYKKKGEDIWRNEQLSFRRLDIPKIETLLNKVKEELFLTKRAEEEKEGEEND